MNRQLEFMFEAPPAIHIMLDLETMGTKAGCPVVEIGAVVFTLEGGITASFFERIDIETCHLVGLKSDPATETWWEGQGRFAGGGDKFREGQTLEDALRLFSTFVTKQADGDIKRLSIWGNGADFDLPILRAAYTAVDSTEPWGHRSGRCYRTIKSLPQYASIQEGAFEGLRHNALNDALHQAVHLIKMLTT